MSAVRAPSLPMRVGSSARSLAEHLGSLAWLAAECARQSLRLRRPQLRVIARTTANQVRFTAVEALPLLTLAALLVGSAMLLQVFGQLRGMVSDSYLSQLVPLLVVSELGPLFVAVVVVGRSGTAIAGEMATLRLDRQLDTLYAIGVDPITYLLLPRLAGGVISMFVLIVLFDGVALFGGFVLASLLVPVSYPLYLDGLEAAIGPSIVLATLLKAFAFGSAVPLVCANSGLRVKGSPTEIPQAVTRAAVDSIVTVFLLSALISLFCRG